MKGKIERLNDKSEIKIAADVPKRKLSKHFKTTTQNTHTLSY